MAQSVGIQQLIASKSVVVKQKTTVFEGNKYDILDSNGKAFLFAAEENCITSFLGSKNRSFHMNVCDEQKNQVLSIRRPYTFGPDKIEVSMFGKVVSVIRQKRTMMTAVIYINDASDRPVLRIKGPPAGFTTGDCFFDLQTANKITIGSIHKKFGGLMKELFTQSDQFEIKFPGDLDVRFKAAVIGACLLIDFLFYER